MSESMSVCMYVCMYISMMSNLVSFAMGIDTIPKEEFVGG